MRKLVCFRVSVVLMVFILLLTSCSDEYKVEKISSKPVAELTVDDVYFIMQFTDEKTSELKLALSDHENEKVRDILSQLDKIDYPKIFERATLLQKNKLIRMLHKTMGEVISASIDTSEFYNVEELIDELKLLD